MVNIEIIMNNTYGVLTNRCSVEDAMFYGNPYDIECADIDEVINFYENTEEYERCSELMKVKNSLQLENLIESNLW